MNLVDMAYTKAEIKDERREMAVASPSVTKYPWGLQIRLEREELDKLGITELPDVGDTLTMTVAARVTAASETQMADSQDSECCVTLQITQMGVMSMTEEPGEKEPAAPARGGTLTSMYR